MPKAARDVRFRCCRNSCCSAPAPYPDVSRVDFYILSTSGELARQQFACRLAEKAYKLKHNVHIHVANQESARRLDDLLWTFRDGSFDGPEKRFTPKGWVHDKETNAEWRMQFLWPFKSAYLIVYLDRDYQKTIIGVPDRNNVWIMSRKSQMSDAEYERMLSNAASLGYDVAKVKRVPQRWPAE